MAGAKPIRAICPFQAGSTVDVLGRIITDPLARRSARPIVVENRGGAGGSIGSAAVAQADPDGYTLLINAAAHTAAPAAYPNITYDPAKDFAGVAMIGVVPNVIVIAPSKGIKTAKELVGEGQGRRDDLRIGRRRQRDALGRRALPPQRRLRGARTCRSAADRRR